MRLRTVWLVLAITTVATATDQDVTVRHARNWQANASEGWCAIKVRVDGEAEFALRGEVLTIRTSTGDPARDVASECSTPLPRNVEDFRFKGVDGRGDVRLLEEPTARNRWMAVVRVRDTKAGSEEYHFRLEWGRGSSFSGGDGRRGDGSRPAGSSSVGDTARMRTRELRREIERLYQSTYNQRPSNDVVDDYIDRVRIDRWSLDQLRSDIERRR